MNKQLKIPTQCVQQRSFCISRSNVRENKQSRKTGGENMAHEQLTLHEAMEVHEMLNFKTVCMTKSKLMQGLVFDQELKAVLQKDVEQSMRAIEVLQSLENKTVPQ